MRLIHTCQLGLALALIAVGGTGPAPAIAADSESSWPAWLQEAMAKEHKKIRYKRLSLGPVETVMPGKITAREEGEDGRYYAASDDGSGAPFECWFFNETINMATATANFAEVLIENASSRYGPVAYRQIHSIDAGQIEGSPFISLEWLYAVGEAPNALVALTKVRAARRDDLYVVCAHSLPGYRDSFAKGFAEVVRNMAPIADTPKPYYTEVHVFSFNGINSGVTHVQMTMDEEGDTRIEESSGMLVPVSGSDLRTSDDYSISWSTPDGYLINTVHADVENGDLVSDLSLQLDDHGAWQVDGTLSGKPVSEDLGAEAEPLSYLGQMLVMRQLMHEPDANSAEMASWLPSADPTTFSNVTIAFEEGSETQRNGTVMMGPIKFSGQFDANGSLRSGTMDLGNAQLSVDRVFARGELR